MIIIGKKLLTRNNIEGMLSDDKVFYVEPDMILSSGAQEILRNRGYVIHYGVRPDTNIGYDMRKEIEDIIEKEYHINDRNVKKAIADRILERLQSN